MKRKTLLLIAAVLMMSLGLVFTTSAQETNDNIVDIIASDGRLDSLHASVVAAELADTLALADQSYTLFAPRDGDFSALEATYPGLTAALLANPSGDLTEILKYHVVAGSYTAAELIEMGTVTSLQGEELTITTQGERVFVNGARVITADTPAKNGIIHVINDILVPSTVTLPEPVVTETTETTEAVEALSLIHI